jgi:hydroxymethylpyrimidine kinase/phosphomethylpyrimidine kinase
MTKPPVCLTIAGLDPSGGAGVIADIKTFSAFGCFAAAAVTSITFQNTTGVFGAEHQSAEVVRQQVEPVIDDYEVVAVKTGMLPTGEVIDETARLIGRMNGVRLVVDPVVRSTSGFDLIDDAALRVLVEKLFPLADIVTPNRPEAERITGRTINSRSDVEAAAREMQSMGARNVLIKGGHMESEQKAIDYLFLGENVHEFEAPFIDTTATHGTGCTLAAAIAANLALGKGLVDAVKIGKDFVTYGYPDRTDARSRSLADKYLGRLLCYWNKNWCEVSYAEGNAGSRAKSSKAEHSRRIESQSRRSYLSTNPKLTDTLRPKLGLSVSCADAAIDLGDEIDPIGDAEYSCQAIEENVVLREVLERCAHNSEADVPVDIRERRSLALLHAELLLQDQLRKDIYLIGADTLRLVAVRHLESELQSECRHKTRLAHEPYLCRDNDVAEVVR